MLENLFKKERTFVRILDLKTPAVKRQTVCRAPNFYKLPNRMLKAKPTCLQLICTRIGRSQTTGCDALW